MKTLLHCFLIIILVIAMFFNGKQSVEEEKHHVIVIDGKDTAWVKDTQQASRIKFIK